MCVCLSLCTKHRFLERRDFSSPPYQYDGALTGVRRACQPPQSPQPSSSLLPPLPSSSSRCAGGRAAPVGPAVGQLAGQGRARATTRAGQARPGQAGGPSALGRLRSERRAACRQARPAAAGEVSVMQIVDGRHGAVKSSRPVRPPAGASTSPVAGVDTPLHCQAIAVRQCGRN